MFGCVLILGLFVGGLVVWRLFVSLLVCMVDTCFGLLMVGSSWFACVSCLCVV